METKIDDEWLTRPRVQEDAMKPLNITDDRPIDAEDWLMPDYHKDDPRSAKSKPDNGLHQCNHCGQSTLPLEFRCDLCGELLELGTRDKTVIHVKICKCVIEADKEWARKQPHNAG